MTTLDLVILVDEQRRASLDQVAKVLEAKGCHIQKTLPRFRTILCAGDSSLVEGLKSVEGVEAVRPQKNYQLPPMDEKIPQ
jgi:hypothetical protein